MNTIGRPRTRLGRRGIFAERIRRARKALDISQASAAVSLGVDRVTLARWETGAFKPNGPARRFVEMWVAQALGEEVSLGL